MNLIILISLLITNLACQESSPHQPYQINSIDDLEFLIDTEAEDEVRPQTEYLSQPISVFDIHQHPGSFDELGPLGREFVLSTIKAAWIPKGLKTFFLRTFSKLTLSPYGIAIGIKAECLKARLANCGLFAVHSPETWGISSNKSIIEALEDSRNFTSEDGKPYFYGFATIDMARWQKEPALSAEKLRKALEHPQIVGVKLAFVHNNIPLDSPIYHTVYKVAAKMGKPVYHHIGSSPLRDLKSFKTKAEQERYVRSYDPQYLKQIIIDNPQTQIILGHMGFDFAGDGLSFMDECYDLATEFNNVFLEMSSFGRKSNDPDGSLLSDVLGQIKKRGLIGKLIYGSDGPTYPGATKAYIDSTLQALTANNYSFSEAEAVLYGNFVKLAKIQ